MRIPIITHDSDIIPGLANKIVGKWAKVHATGMPAVFYSYPSHSIKYVGIPLDPRIKKVTPKIQNEIKKNLNLPLESNVLLISGGGNGSQFLNELILSLAPELLSTNLSLYIIHLTGQRHEESVLDVYKTLPKHEFKRVIVKAHTNEFYAIAAVADLIVTRAGATTLAELAAAAKACIVIPAEFLSGGHQLKNAEELTRRDAAVVLQHDVSADELLAVINKLLSDDHRRFELARNLYATAKVDAAKNLASIILDNAK
jgi:UDP-N-acetylglucosamine--N-acetylmuramyl-(pentapeptide) pyrophosphoryl-undecaprenol N-acetylglucosamine transferase